MLKWDIVFQKPLLLFEQNMTIFFIHSFKKKSYSISLCMDATQYFKQQNKEKEKD